MASTRYQFRDLRQPCRIRIRFIIYELTLVTPVDIGDALFWESDRIVVEHPEAISERKSD